MANDEIKVEAEGEDEGKDELDEGTTDWEAEAKRLQGISKRRATKVAKLKGDLDLAKKAATVTPATVENKKGFDYGQKAFLTANQIKSSEFALVEEAMQHTGKDIEGVLESKWFQAELKERREMDATKNATPEGARRSGQSARDQVEYWIQKGELPPADQRELRQKVVNARMKSDKAKSQFTDTPVIQSGK